MLRKRITIGLGSLAILLLLSGPASALTLLGFSFFNFFSGFSLDIESIFKARAVKGVDEQLIVAHGTFEGSLGCAKSTKGKIGPIPVKNSDYVVFDVVATDQEDESYEPNLQGAPILFEVPEDCPQPNLDPIGEHTENIAFQLDMATFDVEWFKCSSSSSQESCSTSNVDQLLAKASYTCAWDGETPTRDFDTGFVTYPDASFFKCVETEQVVFE